MQFPWITQKCNNMARLSQLQLLFIFAIAVGTWPEAAAVTVQGMVHTRRILEEDWNQVGHLEQGFG